MKNKKGFSLLELLVVVLIIGILGAIALPYYQLAVDKADFMKYQSMVTSLRDAYNHYVLIHGEGTADVNKLSVSLPDDFSRVFGGASSAIQCFQNKDMFCCMSDSGESHSGLVNCGKNDESVICVRTMLNKDNSITSQRMRCLAKQDNARANRLCNALGTEAHTGNTWTPSGVSDYIYKNYYLK